MQESPIAGPYNWMKAVDAMVAEGRELRGIVTYIDFLRCFLYRLREN